MYEQIEAAEVASQIDIDSMEVVTSNLVDSNGKEHLNYDVNMGLDWKAVAFPVTVSHTYQRIQNPCVCDPSDSTIPSKSPAENKFKAAVCKMICRPSAKIHSRHEIYGEIVYLVELQTESTRFLLRRYEDFQELDAALRFADSSAYCGQPRSISALPELPESSRFGFRASMSSLGLGDFNQRRQAGLQSYLSALLAQMKSIDDDANLQRFVFDSALPSGLPPFMSDGLQRLLDNLVHRLQATGDSQEKSLPLKSSQASKKPDAQFRTVVLQAALNYR